MIGRIDDYILGVVAAGLLVLLVSCAYLQKGCQVVDLTDDACRTFVLPQPDGSKIEVHMDRVQAQAFVRTGAVPADGGCAR